MTVEDIGAQLPQPDPRGWLVFEHLPPDLQDAEDATQYADISNARDRNWAQWSRNATTAERVLLGQHLGYELPAVLLTRIEMQTNSVRKRKWPALEDQTPQPITEGE